MNNWFIGILLLTATGIAAYFSLTLSPFVWFATALFAGLAVLFFIDITQKSSAIFRNFPIVGRFRSVASWMRPKIHQYFVESDTEGRPFSKIKRDIVYHRAEDSIDTTPFGTQLDVYEDGYEWLNHSIGALDHHDLNSDPRCLIGGPQCTQPYSASLYNISAMSYGSLSSVAIQALNGGAAIGGFAHNTGEGGISDHHLKHGGDLIYQLGTGYFGARSEDGHFSPELFKERTADDRVKMIELKLSQGAKPGHGGILPAGKVTKEISKIRNVPLGKDVLSPPFHKAFNTPIGLLNFIQQMRELSGGKPVGFKLCVGHKAEFLSICKAIVQTGIYPDFIAIDGAEGGTGAAPLEFSNHVGMPYKEALAFAYNALIGFGIKEHIKLIAAGKITTGFDMFRALSIGADVCYSARAMMLALGCIQALECNRNTCPTGVATNDPKLMRGLVVSDKKEKVAHFHKETVASFVELQAAAGVTNHDAINRSHLQRRVGTHHSVRYDSIFPYLKKNVLLNENSIPDDWKTDMALSSVDKFLVEQPLEYLHL